MPKLTEHPGVSIVPPPHHGYPYQLYFKHPQLRDADGERRQVKRSVKTTDGREAKELAIKLSNILSDPQQWKNLPDKTPPILKELWTGDIVDESVAKRIAVETLKEVWPNATTLLLPVVHAASPDAGKHGESVAEMQTAIPIGELTAADILGYIASNGLDQKDALARSVSRVIRELLDENITLRAEMKSQLNLNRALGADVDETYAPKLLADAIKDFYSDDKAIAGTSAGKRRKGNCSAHVKRFAKDLPDGQVVQEVKPEQVIAHLAALERGEHNGGKKPKIKSVKAVWKAISPFLVHQTKGIFKPFGVRQWIKTHLSGDEKRSLPVWLDQQHVDKLLPKLSDYWKAVALIQWGGGFRPEELPHLQSKLVTFNGDIRVEVDAIYDGDRCVWKPKEKNSYGRVHLPDYCRKTLQALLKGKGLVLFPNDPAQHGWKHPKYRAEQSFERANKVWNAEQFCQAYLAALRKAANAAKLKTDKKLDGRTLRRSAGKRFLLASDCNVDKTAAFLRNTPIMVRNHYATLLPDDISQPAAK